MKCYGVAVFFMCSSLLAHQADVLDHQLDLIRNQLLVSRIVLQEIKTNLATKADILAHFIDLFGAQGNVWQTLDKSIALLCSNYVRLLQECSDIRGERLMWREVMTELNALLTTVKEFAQENNQYWDQTQSALEEMIQLENGLIIVWQEQHKELFGEDECSGDSFLL